MSLFRACLVGSFLPVAALAHDPVQRNAGGFPVRDPDGTLHVYTAAQLAASPAAQIHPRAGDVGTQAVGVGGTRLWSYVSWGNGVGLSGIRVVTTSHGPEIVLGGGTTTFGSNGYWYAARWRSATQSYEQVWASGNYNPPLRRIEVGDVLPDPGWEIVLLQENGQISVLAAEDKQVLASFPAVGGNALELHDLGGDALLEILTAGDTTLRAYGGTGALLWQRAGQGGVDIAVGEMDGDPSLEVATTDGKVLDVASQTTQCTWSQGFGFRLEAIDFDADGKEELVFAQPWSFLYAFDVDTCLPKWSLSNFNTGAMAIADGNGDGTPELIVGDAQWGAVHAHDLVSQAPLWSINNPQHGTTDVTVADVDGDGVSEVLWGAGASSTGEDRLYVGNPQTHAIEWQNIQLDGPFVGPARGDLDGDGAEELVVASNSSDAGYGAPRLVVFDAATLAVRGVSQETCNNLGWEGVGQVKVHDVDGDSRGEILIAACTTYDGLVEIYDFAANGTFTEIWDNNTLPSGSVFRCVEAADVDGDGQLEILAGVAGAHTGSPGIFVYVYDYATGAEEGHTLHLGGGTFGAVTGLEVGDFDFDGTLEFAALSRNSGLWVLDGATRAVEAFVDLPDAQHLKQWSRTTLEPPALLVARGNGSITVRRHHGGQYPQVASLPIGGAVNGFDLGRGQLLGLGLGNRVTLRFPFTNVAWQSEDLGPGAGRGFVFQPTLSRLVATAGWGVFAFQLF
jgi:hypothetical protein